MMAVGVLLCLIAFTGHVAAEVVNGCCLCCVSYAFIVVSFDLSPNFDTTSLNVQKDTCFMLLV